MDLLLLHLTEEAFPLQHHLLVEIIHLAVGEGGRGRRRLLPVAGGACLARVDLAQHHIVGQLELADRADLEVFLLQPGGAGQRVGVPHIGRKHLPHLGIGLVVVVVGGCCNTATPTTTTPSSTSTTTTAVPRVRHCTVYVCRHSVSRPSATPQHV